MNQIKMTLIGLLVMMAFVVAPVYAEHAQDMMDQPERGAPGTQQPGAQQPGVGEQDRDMQDREMMDDPMARQDGHIQASELMDKQVHDQQGNEVGSVSDLVINQQGEVEFLVISEGTEFLGIGEEDLIPVPWDMVQADQYTHEDDAITITLDEQALRDAPTFTSDEWEAFTRGEMDQEVRGYYDEHGPATQERDQWQMDQPEQDQEEWENERDPDPEEGPGAQQY